MPHITFDEPAADALCFVIKGAARGDHDSVIFIEVEGSHATISTQGVAPSRSMKILVDDPDGDMTYALRAKSLESIAKKVDEGRNLVINFKDDTKINMSCGATSGNLVNLFDYVVDTRANIKVEERTSADASFALNAIVSASKTATGEGIVSISDDGQGMTVGSGVGDIRTQEIVDATLLHPDEDYSVRVLGKHLKPLHDVTKIEDIETVDISVGHGAVRFDVPVSHDSSQLAEVSLQVPTYVTHLEQDPSPCDGDLDAIASLEKSLFKENLNSLKDFSGSEAIVTIEATENNMLTLRVSDDFSEGKTVIVEDVMTFDTGVFSVSLSSMISAVNATSNSLLKLSDVSHLHDSHWLVLSSEFDESVEDETGNSDIIVAVLQR